MRTSTAALIVLALGGSARAQHDHAAHHHAAATPATAPASTVTATLGAIAAEYEARLYQGNYQGVSGALDWMRGRASAGAMVAGYRIDKNGRAVTGIGDVMLRGGFAVVDRAHLTVTGALMVSLPTGSDDAGLGMGHVMIMPSASARWQRGALGVTATLGFCRGLGDGALHAEHGGKTWPLVEPMNFSEAWAGVGADVALGGGWRAGAQTAGAVPVLRDGESRVIAGGRVAWRTGRLETGAELQVGLVNDPYRVRGLVTTAMTFP